MFLAHIESLMGLGIVGVAVVAAIILLVMVALKMR